MGMRRELTHLLRSGYAVFLNNVMQAAQYRIGMATWASVSLLQVMIYLSVWRAVAVARGGSVDGFTPEKFAGYFIVLLVVREATYTWTAWQLEDWVRQGSLSPRLLRPMHPLVEMFGSMSAWRLQSAVLLVPAAALIFVAFDAEIAITAPRAALAAALFAPAMLVRFFGDCCLSCLSFWLTRVAGLRNMYYTILLFLSGQFAPIAVLPEPLQTLAHALPFYWVLGYPTELLTGAQPLGSVPQAAAMLSLWGGAMFVLLRVLWERGVARYGAVGA